MPKEDKSKQELRKTQHALYDVSRKGYHSELRDLLEDNPNIHFDRDVCLRLASKGGHVEVVKMLLEHGADISINEYYPLRWAASGGHVEVVKLLLDAGSDVSAIDYEALEFAISEGHYRVVQLLMKRVSRNVAFRFCGEAVNKRDIETINVIMTGGNDELSVL